MRRRGKYTYAGGKRREMRWWRGTHLCHYCQQAIALEYQTDAETPDEEASDKYRALRAKRWHARIERDRSVWAWCSFYCLEVDYES